MLATACAAMPSRRPVKPSPSVVVALTLTWSTLSPAISAIRVAHGGPMGPDLRRLGDDRTIHMVDDRSARAEQFDGVREKQGRVRAFPARVGRREMLADIAKPAAPSKASVIA